MHHSHPDGGARGGVCGKPLELVRSVSGVGVPVDCGESRRVCESGPR